MAMRAAKAAVTLLQAQQRGRGLTQTQMRCNSNVVRLLTRMDEDEELPRVQLVQERAEALGARVPLLVAASCRGGRGVFAGAAIAAGETVEVCPVLALRRDHIAADCTGMRYFFSGVEGDTLLCVLGFGMLYNHAKMAGSQTSQPHDAANLNYALQTSPPDACDDNDGGVCVHFSAARDIQEGEELLIDYSDRWWEAKGETPS
mmetsp:Transcript_40319/g.93464  ORF Transcript_40319/g.93464 Transcript_40319/m.93464 type:complete len:203 (+) Transcript_40319:155-763(+)